MKKAVFLLISIVVLCLSAKAQSFIRKDSIFQVSQKENKAVLLVFSGSDWCANCIRFEKKIMSDLSFQVFLNDNLLYLPADFPQRKKQTEAERKQNEWLAERYNPKGIFPTIILITSKNKIISIPYQNENASVFTDRLIKLLETAKQEDGAQN